MRSIRFPVAVAVLLPVLLAKSLVHVSPAAAAPVGPGPIGEVYLQKSKMVPAGDQVSLKVDCPGDREILSGGTYVSGSETTLSVASNGPADGADADRKADDAWKGSINNGSSYQYSMTVRVQCAARSDGRYIQHITERRTIPANGGGGTRIDCPPLTKVTGGGVIIATRSKKAPIASTKPFDGIDGGYVHDDAWATSYINDTGRSVHETMTVICAAPNALGPLGGVAAPAEAPGTMPASIQASASVDCPAGSITLGGGVGEASTTSDNTSVASIWAADLGPGVRWRGWMNNLTASSQTFTVRAMCFDPY